MEVLFQTFLPIRGHMTNIEEKNLHSKLNI